MDKDLFSLWWHQGNTTVMGEGEQNHVLPGAAQLWLSSQPRQDRENPAGISEQKSSVRNINFSWLVVWPDLTWVLLKRERIPTVLAETLLWLVINQAEHYPHTFKNHLIPTWLSPWSLVFWLLNVLHMGEARSRPLLSKKNGCDGREEDHTWPTVVCKRWVFWVGQSFLSVHLEGITHHMIQTLIRSMEEPYDVNLCCASMRQQEGLTEPSPVQWICTCSSEEDTNRLHPKMEEAP